MKSKLYFAALIIGAISSLGDCPAQQPPSSKSVHENEALWGNLKSELQSIIKETDYDDRHEKLKQLSLKLAPFNPEDAWGLTKTIAFIPDKIAFSVPFVKQWGRNNPLKALERIRELPDGEMRLMVTNSALQGWAGIAPLEALQWASANLSASYRRTAYAQIGEVWVRKDPVKATNWGMNLSNELERIFYVAEVLEYWAEALPMDAANWVSKLPPGKFHDLMISKVVSVWVQHYPKMAAEWIIGSQEYHWLLPNAVGKWARFDHIAAAAWLSLIADEHLSSLCHAAIVTEWAVYNPDAAYKWAEANLKGEQLTNARRVILGNWTADYPLEVLNWSQDLQPPEKRMAALEIIFETWSLSDLTACKAWVSEQKAGLYRDTGLSKIADVMMESEPEAAAELALSIGNPLVQKISLTHVIETWKSRESEKADAWVRKHPNVLNSAKP